MKTTTNPADRSANELASLQADCRKVRLSDAGTADALRARLLRMGWREELSKTGKLTRSYRR